MNLGFDLGSYACYSSLFFTAKGKSLNRFNPVAFALIEFAKSSTSILSFSKNLHSSAAFSALVCGIFFKEERIQIPFFSILFCGKNPCILKTYGKKI
jgi:hypothetical protein